MKDIDRCFNSGAELIIQWFLSKKCNLECQCCFFSSDELKNSTRYSFDLNKVIPFIKKFNKKVMITFAGGEPMLSENFIEFVEWLTNNGHIANIQTNLTAGISKLIEKCDVSKISIGGSLHLKELEKKGLLDVYIKNYKLVKQANILYFQAFEVADPRSYSTEDIQRYTDILKPHGIDINFTPMKVQKESGSLYELFDYSQDQLTMFNNLNVTESYINNPSECFNKKCSAGMNHVVIINDEVFPCYSYYSYLGDIINNNVSLNTRPITCNMKFCDCPYYVDWLN